MAPLLFRRPVFPSWKVWTGVAVIIGSFPGFEWNALTAQTVETQGSFTDKIELADPKAAIAGVVSDTEESLKQNLILTEQVRSISEALTQARTETDAAQTENRELKTRLEALGLNAVGKDRSKLEQRLVKAVNDLSVAQTALVESRRNLAALTEAILALVKTSKDISPEARMAVETEIRRVNQQSPGEVEGALKAEALAANLTNARVISYKPELGLLVGNIGSDDAVKIGMPFRVYDGQKPIAVVRTVDVREKIFGALIQETLSENTPVRVGCRLKVVAN